MGAVGRLPVTALVGFVGERLDEGEGGERGRANRPAISNALRATGKLDDFEVAVLVLAGVMKKVHLRHPSYREQAACGQPSSPTTGTA